VLSLATVILLSTLTLTSCNRSFDEAVVLEEGEKLLKTAEMLNIVYFGSGIEYYDNDEELGYYRKANAQHLEKLGFRTIEELKKITEETFSKRYSASVYSTILSPLTNETAIVSPARYYQTFDEKTGEPTYIMVYSRFTPLFKDSVTYDYDTLRVEGSKKEKVNLLIDATVTNSEGQSQNVTLTVTLVEDESGWRIDNHTFANYNALKDAYDELNNQDIKK
jgi:hypothetical protein